MLLVLAKGGKEQTSEYTPFVPVRVLDIFNLFFSFPTPNCNCSTLMRSNGEVPSSCLKGMQLVGGFYLLPRTSTLAEGPARIAA